MGRIRQEQAVGPYERVLERVALALEQAERAGQDPSELELHGLSDGEIELIRAFLQRDASWLSGWHAAAREHANVARRARRSRILGDGLGPAAALQVVLDCAFCGVEVHWPRQPGTVACPMCGSRLMKVHQARQDESH